MQASSRSNGIKLVLSVLFLGAALLIYLHPNYVGDQISYWQFKPTLQVREIASSAQLSDHGKFIFFASKPQINDRITFNSFCRKQREKTAVLGCYSGRTIHIYDISDIRLKGIKEVTSAHEMLHAAYDRLSFAERKRVDNLISVQLQMTNNQKVQKRIALYDQSNALERANELHSMLGTEVRALSPELEQYYGKYFSNRAALVTMSEHYELIFDEIEQKQTSLIAELNGLADNINREVSSYTSDYNSLEADIDSFNTRAKSGSFSSQVAFNSERSRLVSLQTQLDVSRSDIQEKINTFNTKKAELDSLNVQAKDLQKSIDSTALPEVPSI